MFPSEWREFPSAPCLAGKKNLMTARVSMLLKSQASLTRFRNCFLPGRAKDLSAPLYYITHFNNIETRAVIKFFFPARQGAEGNSRHSDRNINLFLSWSG
jgi:hypothetical protein